jgi:uncharacterized protein
MRIAYLDGHRLRRALVAACDYTEAKRRELNRINVFPVPDGDTGTNLALTVRAVADHLRRNADQSVSVVAREAAEAAVLGARGNSGMMLSHFLLGFAEAVGDRKRVGTTDFTDALESGVASLYAAIERPVEGTILTVIRETAEGARACEVADFRPYLEALLRHARSSLERTPELLPVLKEAGVVDAGAKGFVHIIEGAVEYMIRGDLLVGRAPDPAPIPEDDDAGAGGGALAAGAAAYGGNEQFRYCTEALVRGDALPTAEQTRAALREMGDSLVVIRTGDVLKVHIHSDEPERVFAWLRERGTLATHKAEDMEAQHRTLGRGGHASLARRPVGIVTESAQDLPAEVVRAHGIHVVPVLLLEGETVYRDGIDITALEFHERMERGGELPTTSQPAPGSFLQAFGRAAEDGEEVLYVGLSGALSGTFASAEAAASRFDRETPLHLFDSRAASILQGLLVLKAAELAEEGVAPAEILPRLEQLRDGGGLLFTVDTFERLLASGRVSRGRAWMARTLGIKPILELSGEGAIIPAGKALGRERVLRSVLRTVEARVPVGSKVRFGVVHVGRPEVIDRLGRELRARYGRHTEILSAPVTPVLATHLGPGAWGVGWLVEDALPAGAAAEGES